MAVHYEVPLGKNLVIAGPANVMIKGGELPLVVTDGDELTAAAPVLSALVPPSVESGAEDIVLVIEAAGLDGNSTIVFGNYDEPTTLSDDGLSVSTIVKPSLFAPAVVPVSVRNGPARSAPLDFTFLDPEVAAAAASKKKSKS